MKYWLRKIKEKQEKFQRENQMMELHIDTDFIEEGYIAMDVFFNTDAETFTMASIRDALAEHFTDIVINNNTEGSYLIDKEEEASKLPLMDRIRLWIVDKLM